MNFVLLELYRFIIAPLIVVLLPFIALFNSKVRQGLRLRKQRHDPLPEGNDPIWIHAASGEFEYAKAVIRQCKDSYPGIPIVVTYFSPSFAKGVTGFAGVDRAVALPIDLPGPCQSFLNKMHPRLLLVARTDLWPEMLAQCRKRKIPIVLFSYTQRKFPNLSKRIFTQWMLHWVQRIYCVSEFDRGQLRTISLPAQVEVMGDTRYDQVEYRLSHAQKLPEGLIPKGEAPCFVAGSTWPEDEAVLLPALADFCRSGSIKLILVPHEPSKEHLSALEKQLGQLSLSHAFFSNNIWNSENVLIVDKVGVLAELYGVADLAFIGGSFRKGVHSVMEALGAGCLTFVGPFHENNREAMEFKSIPIGNRFGVEVVHSHQELRDKLDGILKFPQALSTFSEQLKYEFQNRLGASRKLVDSLATLIH